MSQSERSKKFWAEVRAGLRPPPQRKRSGVTRREVRCISNWVKSGLVVLSIYPHGELGFREKSRRVEYKLSLVEAFRQAVVLTTLKMGNRVKALRKEGYGLKEARKKARKEFLSL